MSTELLAPIYNKLNQLEVTINNSSAGAIVGTIMPLEVGDVTLYTDEANGKWLKSGNIATDIINYPKVSPCAYLAPFGNDKPRIDTYLHPTGSGTTTQMVDINYNTRWRVSGNTLYEQKLVNSYIVRNWADSGITIVLPAKGASTGVGFTGKHLTYDPVNGRFISMGYYGDIYSVKLDGSDVQDLHLDVPLISPYLPVNWRGIGWSKKGVWLLCENNVATTVYLLSPTMEIITSIVIPLPAGNLADGLSVDYEKELIILAVRISSSVYIGLYNFKGDKVTHSIGNTSLSGTIPAGCTFNHESQMITIHTTNNSLCMLLNPPEFKTTININNTSAFSLGFVEIGGLAYVYKDINKTFTAFRRNSTVAGGLTDNETTLVVVGAAWTGPVYSMIATANHIWILETIVNGSVIHQLDNLGQPTGLTIATSITSRCIATDGTSIMVVPYNVTDVQVTTYSLTGTKIEDLGVTHTKSTFTRMIWLERSKIFVATVGTYNTSMWDNKFNYRGTYIFEKDTSYRAHTTEPTMAFGYTYYPYGDSNPNLYAWSNDISVIYGVGIPIVQYNTYSFKDAASASTMGGSPLYMKVS